MNPMARKIIMDKASRRDMARGYDITAYDKGYVSGYDEAYRKGYDRGMDEARRSSMDMANHHNVPMDMNYDNAYIQGYDKGYQDKAYEMLTPYGNTGMTVSGDGRQGVKGTGPYGIGGSMYRRDRGEEMRLDRQDMEMWKHDLENADGTKGYHFELPQIEQAMRSLGIQPKEYTEEELCMTANMLYSDYCKTFKNIIPKDKEAMYYTSMARDFLEDKDASAKGSEKLMAYYHCIVKD
jgi:hypothetical protein